ncbi:MAG: hypothetical protein J6J07_00505 [Oscillospiraceae bacterium]|nr:hypothetical protein [Oscillospiraceae bacterium]
MPFFKASISARLSPKIARTEEEKSCSYLFATSCGVAETEFEHPENKNRNTNDRIIFLI